MFLMLSRTQIMLQRSMSFRTLHQVKWHLGHKFTSSLKMKSNNPRQINVEYIIIFITLSATMVLYYMANPVLGKSLCSDWFFLGQDFAIRVFLFWSEAGEFKICNQNSEKKV